MNNPEETMTFMAKTAECIPILPWETIGEVLEKAGYEFIMKDKWFLSPTEYECFLSWYDKDDKFHNLFRQAKSRQEAVMVVVIELGKKCDETKRRILR